MPEFFEVKRIREYLIQGGLVGNRFTSLVTKNGGQRVFKGQCLPLIQNALPGQTLTQIKTRAKYTLLFFQKGIIVWHYRFTGVPHIQGFDYDRRLQSIHFLPIDSYAEKFIRFVIHFSNATLHFVDSRCLSHLYFYPTQKEEEIALFAKLAPDLSNYSFPSFASWQKINQKERTIKSDLQDQTTPPSGIGNYLACEILYKAKINPWQPCHSLNKKQYDNLVEAIRWVCEMAMRFDDYHWFGAYNQPSCKACHHPILRKKHGAAHSQTTHFCPQCQPLVLSR